MRPPNEKTSKGKSAKLTAEEVWIHDLLKTRGLDIGLTPKLIEKHPPEGDFPRYQSHYYGSIIMMINALREEQKQSGEDAATPSPGQYQRELKFIKNMSFVQAIFLLPQFQHFVLSWRASLGIQPEKLREQLGFSEEELALATYSVKPEQMAAVLIQLGKMKEWGKRGALRKKKLNFEYSILSRSIQRRKKSVADARIDPPSPHKPFKFPWIPESQVEHVMNFVFYGVDTGKLISLSGLEGNFGREWRNRLMKDERGKGHMPFMRYYLYYFYRVTKKGNMTTVNRALKEFGFPPAKHNQGPTLEKRYEDYFLK